MPPPLTRRIFCGTGSALALTRLAPARMAHALLAPSKAIFTNPIFHGDHPDASPLRVGDDFYITHSSLVYAPGLIVWHSRDLVRWRPVCAAVQHYVGNVYAPYMCEHQGRFYIYFPVSGELFVVHATLPEGPWSAPVSLHVHGIDPAHLAMPDGRRYLYFAGGRIVDLSPDGLTVVGEPRHAYDAWPIPDTWRVQCECLEAPKVTLKDGYIYLTVAEGGTNGPPTSHMTISMRSRNPEGPWELSPHNPILHTTSRDQHWWSIGHGRLVEATDGSWWMTCHAYENGYRSLGRNTLLVPIEWTHDGWYRVTDDVADTITRNAPLPAPSGFEANAPALPALGFAGATLDLRFQFWKGYDAKRFTLADNTLTLAADGPDPAHTSVLTCMPGEHSYTTEVDVEIEPGCSAGLLLFYNDQHFIGLELSAAGLRLHRNGSTQELHVRATRLTLRLVNDDQELDLYYRVPDHSWTRVPYGVEVVDFTDNVLGGFLDLRPGLFACGTARAHFRNFICTPGAQAPRH